MQNWAKWVIAIVISFAFSAISALTDAHCSLVDVARHGAIGPLPTLGALKVTLEKGLGIGQ